MEIQKLNQDTVTDPLLTTPEDMSPSSGLRASHSPIIDASVRPGIERLVASAELLVKHGDFIHARSLVVRCLQENSISVPALRLALKVFELSSSQRLSILQTLFQQNPNFEDRLSLAHQHYEMEHFLLARELYFECLSELISEHPAQFEIYKNLANTFCFDADLDAAEEYYMKALACRPSSGLIRCNLGYLEMQRQKWNEAEVFFQQALACPDSPPRAWVGLALLDLQKKDFEMAKAHVLQCLDRDPLNRVALQTLGNIALQTDDFSNSLEAFAHYLSSHAEDVEMRKAFMALLDRAGRQDLLELELIQMESVS